MPSPAMGVALLALFVSLGGTGYALSGSNTVASDDIIDGQVLARDIAGNAVKTGKLKRGAVTTAKVRNGTLRREDVAPGQFATPAQVPAATSVRTRTKREREVPNDSSDTDLVTLPLPAGKYAISVRTALQNETAVSTFGYCSIRDAADNYYYDFELTPLLPSERFVFFDQIGVTLAQPRTMRLVCSSDRALTAWHSSIQAIRVGAEAHDEAP